jgi:hypothetical protein
VALIRVRGRCSRTGTMEVRKNTCTWPSHNNPTLKRVSSKLKFEATSIFSYALAWLEVALAFSTHRPRLSYVKCSNFAHRSIGCTGS